MKVFFPSKPKEKVFASTSVSTLNRTFILSRYAQAIHMVLPSSKAPPDFDPMQKFHLHLKEDCGGFRQNHMQRI